MREELHLLSSFPGDPTVGFIREQGTKSIPAARALSRDRNWEFRQTPRGRGFSPTRFISCLRVI